MVRKARAPPLSSSLGPWAGSRPPSPGPPMPSTSQASGKLSRAQKGPKAAQAPAPTSAELVKQVSVLKKLHLA